MDGSGGAGGGLAEGLSEGVGNAGNFVHLVAGLDDGQEGGGVVVLLVDVAVAVLGGDGVGHGDDGGLGHEGVGEAGGEVGGADALGHADAWAFGGAGVAVGHVCGGFFAVGDDAADVHVFHFGHDAEEGGGDLEDASEAVGLEELGDVAVAGGAGHGGLLGGCLGGWDGVSGDGSIFEVGAHVLGGRWIQPLPSTDPGQAQCSSIKGEEVKRGEDGFPLSRENGWGRRRTGEGRVCRR